MVQLASGARRIDTTVRAAAFRVNGKLRPYRVAKLLRRRGAAQVRRGGKREPFVDRARERQRLLATSQPVLEQERGGAQHGRWVGGTGSCDVRRGAVHGLEQARA